MIFFFYGDNTYAAAEQIRKLIARYEKSTGSNFGLYRFSGDSDPEQVAASLSAQSMFAESSLVIIENPSQNKTIQDKILANLDRVPDTTVLILHDPEVDKRTKWFKTLQAQAKAKEFTFKSEGQLVAWLQARGRKLGLDFDRGTAQLIIDRSGTDQWRLHQELDKIASSGDASRDKIEELVLATPRHTIFELLDALMIGDIESALRYLDDLRGQNVHELEVLTMIGWQLRNMIVISSSAGRSDNQIAREHGINPYVVKKTKPLLRRLSPESLTAAYRQVIEADYEIKTGGGNDAGSTLDRTILYIGHIGRAPAAD